MKSKRIIYVILLVIWMASVFMLSAQSSDESSNTSQGVVRVIINLIPSIRQMEQAKQDKIVEELQPYARKVAHFTIYTVGGIIIYLNACQYSLNQDKKLLITVILGSLYSITDEAHQMFVPRQKPEKLVM